MHVKHECTGPVKKSSSSRIVKIIVLVTGKSVIAINQHYPIITNQISLLLASPPPLMHARIN